MTWVWSGADDVGVFSADHVGMFSADHVGVFSGRVQVLIMWACSVGMARC